MLFVRRRGLPKKQMETLRRYLDSGKPLVALRTSSHGFAPGGKLPAGSQQWPSFDREVLGCRYHGHGPNQLGTHVKVAGEAAGHPILAHVRPHEWHSPGSIYRVKPLDEKATVLLVGSVLNLSEPVAWTRSYKGGRVFFTSLGHRDDFAQPQFRMLLVGAIHWAMNRPVPTLK